MYLIIRDLCVIPLRARVYKYSDLIVFKSFDKTPLQIFILSSGTLPVCKKEGL